jgi:hypothetical protein
MGKRDFAIKALNFDAKSGGNVRLIGDGISGCNPPFLSEPPSTSAFSEAMTALNAAVASSGSVSLFSEFTPSEFVSVVRP